MIPIDKDASIIGSIRSGPRGIDLDLAHEHAHPNSGSRYASISGGAMLSESTLVSIPSRSYGVIRPVNDLIDLESGRTCSVFSFPSIPTPDQNTTSLQFTETNSNPGSAGSADTDVTLVPSSDSIGDALLASLLSIRPKQPKYLKSTVLAITLLWAIIFAQSLPDHLSLSAPLVGHTPLSVACIIPPIHYTSADLVYLSQTVSGRVKLVVWPDDLIVDTEWQRDVLVEQVHQAIGVQYGVFTLISVHVEETGVKERILVGVDGGIRPGDGGTDWTVYLPP